MKTVSLFSLLVLSALVLAPLAIMPAAAQAKQADENVAPRNGVRFVIVSPTGDSIPSPLYCKQGKKFVPVRISGRTPSVRVRPEAGEVRFWKEDPGAAAEEEQGGKKAKLPEPYMSVKVPGSSSSRTLCILVPSADVARTQSFFVDENDVPLSGMHLINFSPYPLQMVLSKKGDFSDKTVSKVSYFQRSEGISEKNRWSYKGDNGETLSFMLMYKTPRDKDFRRARSSRFVVSNRQSQITVIVKDASRDGVKMLSIQLTDPQASEN